MSPDRLEAIYDETVEQYRRHLRGQGPMPDLAEIPRELHERLRATFSVLEAITGTSDDLVPSLEDIAARVGVVLPEALAAPDFRKGSPVGDVDLHAIGRHLVEELTSLSGRCSVVNTVGDGSVSVGSLQVVAEYRQLGAFMAVCPIAGSERDLAREVTLRAANGVFQATTDYTAVALVSRDDEFPTIVVPPEDCVGALDTLMGDIPPSTAATPLPFLIAVRGFLEYVEPTWDDVPASLAVGAGFDVENASQVAAAEAVQSVAAGKTGIDEKQDALGTLGDQEVQRLATAPPRIVARQLSPADFLREIDELAGVRSP